ncbi:hypothetical protein [Sphingomonas sp.]|uniref:hypothetical protein n=1 Tax=Sphingomonas sp. TaxID=28214 RepID=UPI003CC57E41
MNKTVVVIPGPETVILWGVHIPLLAAVFGVAGIFLGHLMAPVIGAPLPLQRQLSVIAAGVLLSLGITMVTGQKPLVVLGWSIGIGFSGITVFQTMGEQARAGLKTLGDKVVERLSGKDPAP